MKTGKMVNNVSAVTKSFEKFNRLFVKCIRQDSFLSYRNMGK